MLDTSHVTSLRSGSLVDQLIDQITNAIINHELEPGEKLPSENELVEMYQVGKSSIREAIKVLQAVGILEVRRGDGTYICSESKEDFFNPLLFQMMIDPGNIGQLYELRSIFEPASCKLAMEKATKEDLEKLERNIENYKILVASDSHTGKDDIEFHRLILRCTHNPYIIKIGDMIYKLLEKSIQAGCKAAPDKSLNDHIRIFEAIKSNQADRIEAAEIESFKGWVMADN